MSAFPNLLGPFVVGTAVAQTIGRKVMLESYFDARRVLSALIGGIGWDILGGGSVRQCSLDVIVPLLMQRH